MRTDDATADPIPDLVDTHCHLDDASFHDDLDSVLQESRDAGVRAWIMVGFEPSRWDAAITLARTIPGMAHMLGVHPGSAQQWTRETGSRLEHLLVESGARAVGEIGFDFFRDNAPLEVQQRALLDQLGIARNLGLPVVFHLRDAEDEMLRLLRQQGDLPRMVFHSFDGSEALRRFISEHDAVVGVGGLATRQKSGDLRAQLRQIPLSSMILETDSPYLVPARQKMRRNTPAHVRTVAFFLAELLGVEVHEVARVTTATAEGIFGPLVP